MKQKGLTKAQLRVIEHVESALLAAEIEGVRFVFDQDDGSLTAYNAENVDVTYSGRYQEDSKDEEMNWDLGHIVQNLNADYFHSQFDDYYLKFYE